MKMTLSVTHSLVLPPRCVGIELDEKYFELASKRIDEELQQEDMFLTNE
jgi:DNA modification methylase